MTPEQSKLLTPGAKVRITAVDWQGAFVFDVGDTAVLLWLDNSDDSGDWMAKFENGIEWYIEPHICDFEVIE